ncbi:MAG TPA: acetyl-coenzyme A synthetase N-terminal domain-containing protein, partial [Spirochaetota bacterium]|nr:acetyl-coenzyme A synthetase N-terminal domain-containing protein [Spirochaetota bacterium]
MAEVTLKEIYPVPEKFRERAYIKSRADYEKMWKESISDPNGFWGKIAEEYITWFKKWDKVMDCKFGNAPEDLKIAWYT